MQPLTSIKGIGDKTQAKFEKLGIYTVEDLLEHYPRDYQVFENPKPIQDCMEGQVVAIEAGVATIVESKKVRNLTIVSCLVKDPSGAMRLTWFNQPYIKNIMRLGSRYIFYGKIVRKNATLGIDQPKVYTREEYLGLLHKMLPVYTLTEGLSNHIVLKTIDTALSQMGKTKETIPKRILKKYQLVSIDQAMRDIHFPKSKEMMLQARKRLVFDEFFQFTVILQQIKTRKQEVSNSFCIEPKLQVDEFIRSLPYELTNAQKKTYDEIKKDLERSVSMNRLIQGDVGSGKTILAILALLQTALNGYQACLMAPTEVLAKQHYHSLTGLLTQYGIKVELLTGSMTAASKKKAYQRIATHEVDIIVGTHALIQESVAYDQLALVVTDEQHRFGVKQREMLQKKGEHPHILVMSATPIPRTLAIILYGDLDISIVDELPANRLPIKNCVVDTNYRQTAYQFIKNQVLQGRQAYVICPMVEESENIEAENVIAYTQKLKEAMTEIQGIEYLHGKMKAKQKDDIMERFMSGEIKVLVSTTVVEVGVNVPNATVMMIEDAQRFGLAQLHQLRGRVGRGIYQSYCILVSGSTSKETKQRLEILNQSNDGFYVAEQDLKLRGPGDIFGIRQSGELEFKIGDIYNDAALLKAASEEAKNLTEDEYLQLISDNRFLQNKQRNFGAGTL